MNEEGPPGRTKQYLRGDGLTRVVRNRGALEGDNFSSENNGVNDF